MQELLQACQKCISGLLADAEREYVIGTINVARIMHRPMLELARDELAPLASFAANNPAQLSAHDLEYIHRIAAILAPVCPDVAKALGAYDTDARLREAQGE